MVAPRNTPRASRLYFCGMWNPFSGQIQLGPLHARRIARAAAKDEASTVACPPPVVRIKLAHHLVA